LKLIVQINLWGGTVLFLGSPEHHKEYLAKTNAGKMFGVFGLTELGHGTNVRQLETVAQYDAKTDEFIVNSPNWQSQKFWPGGIARDGTHAAVFARLIDQDGMDKGVQAFVVPLRERPGAGNYDGITTYHIPPKICYNGVDNGGLLIKNVRIPRRNHLNGITSLDSPANLSQVLEVFLAGRVAIAGLALGMAKAAVAITAIHSSTRKQFGSKASGGKEVPILEHPLVQRKVLSAISRLFVHSFAIRHCGKLFSASTALDKKFLHIVASGLKSVSTWDFRTMVITCRELLGGQGFIMHNRVGPLIAHADLCTTGEGDNTMLMKQMIQAIISMSWSNYAKLLNQSAKVTRFDRTSKLLAKWRQLGTTLRQELIHRCSISGVDYELEFGIRVATLYIRIFNTDATLAHLSHVVQACSAECAQVLQDLVFLDSWQVFEEFKFELLNHGMISPKEYEQGSQEFKKVCESQVKNTLGLVSSFGIPKASMPDSNLSGPLKSKSNL
jgi:alkylation response protein AidB-like acyl-CoA dehydrogenase